MTAKDALQFRLNWHSLQLAGALRGIGNRDLQRVKSYLRQRFDLEEPKWVAPYQRPKKMLAGLRSNPVYPSDAFPWVAELEAAHPAILDEYQRLTADTLRRHPQDLAVRGRWNVAYLYSRGRAVKKNADRCPKTPALRARPISPSWFPGPTSARIVAPRTPASAATYV
jgi:aspartyl/asparaginyl beta-hydroxylase (cupin superfamily)